MVSFFLWGWSAGTRNWTLTAWGRQTLGGRLWKIVDNRSPLISYYCRRPCCRYSCMKLPLMGTHRRKSASLMIGHRRTFLSMPMLWRHIHEGAASSSTHIHTSSKEVLTVQTTTAPILRMKGYEVCCSLRNSCLRGDVLLFGLKDCAWINNSRIMNSVVRT